MPIASNLRAALAIPALALGVVAMAGNASRPIPVRPAACEITQTDTLAVGQRMAPLTVKYNQDIGDSVTATFPVESKVTVVKLVNGDEPMSVEITAGTEYAVAGTWKLSLAGKGGECVGNVVVVKKESKK